MIAFQIRHSLSFPLSAPTRSLHLTSTNSSEPVLPRCDHTATSTTIAAQSTDDYSLADHSRLNKPLPALPSPKHDSRRPSSMSNASLRRRIRLRPRRSFVKQQKGDLYSKALDAARLRGEWDGNQPTGTGKSIPWSELIRKHSKHNPNEQATSTVANLEQQLRTALSAFYRSVDYSDASHLSDSAAYKGNGTTLFPPVLPLRESGEGWSGEGVADSIKQLDDLQRSARDTSVRHSIAALQAYALFSTGQDENAIELLHSVRFLEDVDREGLKSGSSSGEYTLALIMMGFTVYGMANERLFGKRNDDGYIPFAFAGYASTIDLHEGFRGGTSAKALRGLPPDEIERWGEVALYRNALFSVRNSNSTLSLNALRAYQSNAGRWTVNFRVPQRLVIYRTYLAVLNRSAEEGSYNPPPRGTTVSKEDCRSVAYQSSVLAVAAGRVEVRDFESERRSRLEGNKTTALTLGGKAANGVNGVESNAPRTTSKRRPAASRLQSPSSTWWTNEFLTAQKTSAECLTRTSQFPRAGKINKAALELADELIKGWRVNGERGGYEADELVEILYTLSRFTFHSQRIARLLFTILVAAENYQEARKALALYEQIVDKARQGDVAEAAALAEESKRREAGFSGPNKTTGGGDEGDAEGEQIALLSKEAKESAKEMQIDADSDEVFISTLLHGAHVLVRYLNDATEGDRLARKATQFFTKNQALGKDPVFLAKLKRVSGAARAAFCRSSNDPSLRTTQQDEALSLFKQSLTHDDQSSETYYQLALLQGEMSDVGAAVRSARKAVELEPAHVEYWHLLALLVSANKDYKGALRVAEEGLAEAEDDDEAASHSTAGAANGLPNGNGIVKQSSASTTAGAKRTTLLSVDYPPTRRERAESILRLMITHNALEEVVEGTQAAIEAQREIFEFFHRRYASHNHAQRQMAPNASLSNGRAADEEPSVNGAQANGASHGTHRFSTLLGGPSLVHQRFHSLTGLGHSGSGHQHWSSLRSTRTSKREGSVLGASGNASVAPATARDKEDDYVPITGEEVRNARHAKDESELLCSLWLMAAATFRRSGSLAESRVAIQEAERVDPASGDVWTQLALWCEKQAAGDAVEEQSHRFAIEALYKALACKSDHVGASVHLARLFIANPLNPLVPEHVAENEKDKASLKDVASPLPNTTENFHASSEAAELLNRTQSRKITASNPTSGENAVVTGADDDSSKTKADERKRLATLSMAEGLLSSSTQGSGWSSSEAWLYLSKVMHLTGRDARQRECLEYALQLERSKPVRPISVALQPSC